MDETKMFAAMLVAGLAVGAIFAYTTQQDTQCQQLEQNLKQNANFTGSIACYPPGTLGINNSSVDNRTQAYCECRKVVNGNVQVFNIRVTG